MNGKNTITDKFMVDTGSNRIFQINRPFAEAHKLLAMLPRDDTVEGVGEGIGGRTNFLEARIDSIRLGQYTINRPVVSISQDSQGFGASADAGLIGAEILRRFTVILDYPSSRMLLKPNVHFNEPYEIDMSGLELVAKADNLKAIVVKSVMPNSPGIEAGLREGDEIVSINGHPASEFTLDKVTQMFKQPGKQYLIDIKRANKAMRVTLKTRRRI